ncbi:MAG: thiamine-phosphate kinase [Candidatus Omnitrophica bacterium]|nr:thiamine-phosphate kinase [Candidatus Omnitrophota bacterium]MDE2222328.1 thiamine-phosphate kinase [Candidatus Omnitrophota bacterium]
MQISKLGEFGLIETLKKHAPVSKAVIKGIGDDAAVLPYSQSRYLLFTTDMLAEGIHFTRRMAPQAIGHKAMACNISDIAAMGGYPTFAVVSIGVPKALPVRFVKEIYQGMERLAKAFNVSIVGGDTIKSDKIVINVALLGLVEKKNLVTRSGARPEDWIFVTGALGGSLKSGHHLNFTPRLDQARFLVRKFKPSAMIDISDGLSGDLGHILKASGVGAFLDYHLIPRNKGAALPQALNDGEDFELLFTLPAKRAYALMTWQDRQRLMYFYPIGTITDNVNKRPDAKSFAHF